MRGLLPFVSKNGAVASIRARNYVEWTEIAKGRKRKPISSDITCTETELQKSFDPRTEAFKYIYYYCLRHFPMPEEDIVKDELCVQCTIEAHKKTCTNPNCQIEKQYETTTLIEEAVEIQRLKAIELGLLSQPC